VPSLASAWSSFFYLHAPATTEIYTLSLHDALPIWKLRRTRRGSVTRCRARRILRCRAPRRRIHRPRPPHRRVRRRHPLPRILLRSEEHTSELQSPCNLVCRLLLEKKKK